MQHMRLLGGLLLVGLAGTAFNGCLPPSRGGPIEEDTAANLPDGGGATSTVDDGASGQAASTSPTDDGATESGTSANPEVSAEDTGGSDAPEQEGADDTAGDTGPAGNSSGPSFRDIAPGAECTNEGVEVAEMPNCDAYYACYEQSCNSRIDSCLGDGAPCQGYYECSRGEADRCNPTCVQDTECSGCILEQSSVCNEEDCASEYEQCFGVPPPPSDAPSCEELAACCAGQDDALRGTCEMLAASNIEAGCASSLSLFCM